MKSRAKKDPRRAEFDDLYQRHSREVWALAYARWLNADVAQDIMQEAFLRLWKQWQEGCCILNPRAWLLRVARNLAEDYAKSSFRRNGTHAPETMNAVKGRDLLPLEKMEREEAFRSLRLELNELATADREILTLRYGLDYNATQIAELLEINTTAVHMRLSLRQAATRRSTYRTRSDIATMNEFLSPEPPQGPIDGLLRAFFHKEIPNPWPQAKVLPSGCALPASPSWTHGYSRAILVAAVALLLFGYLTVAGKFPVSSNDGLKLDRERTIGSKPRVESSLQRK